MPKFKKEKAESNIVNEGGGGRSVKVFDLSSICNNLVTVIMWECSITD